uniref:Uncharacterized protein n=1 Tax=Moniliophthora roreri TaxID=221103 RepID=A0A0W0FEU0_MONRR
MSATAPKTPVLNAHCWSGHIGIRQ